ncbi:CAP domain-containing protein [Sphingosinicella rhizophila]|uniref:CAP domain-containing protein n=1 Tax=Sphingosinicella rhizophila TaxID=3050082 RepID=UPI0028F0AB2B|nr:CAP domain-containing protein [Sphingosinicella sp. GR2756]
MTRRSADTRREFGRENVVTKLGSGRSGHLLAVIALASAAPLLQGSAGPLSNLDVRLLAAHNRERETAGLPPLGWDRALASDAARWGDYLAAVGALEHEEDDPGDPDPQGENLWLGTKGHFTAEDMVGMWIEEKAHFVPGAFPDNSRTGDYEDVGHYTQLMWRDTRRVGCAVSRGNDYDVLVCRYRQAGNVLGEQPF